jgi:D-beta-D-heptose 7-phosphate kinase/D-beta-D-heptose 1-phosphate adenosyltransferase
MKLIENFDEDTDKSWDISSTPVDVFNVSGAGDTVVATMSVCLSTGWNELDSAYIANKCAQYVVTQPGTSVVSKNKFIQIIKKYKNGDIS